MDPWSWGWRHLSIIFWVEVGEGENAYVSQDSVRKKKRETLSVNPLRGGTTASLHKNIVTWGSWYLGLKCSTGWQLMPELLPHKVSLK